MAIEIERKFLVTSTAWQSSAGRSVNYRQGYLSHEGGVSVRVRIAGDRANLNIKSATLGIRRLEFEYSIPLDDAIQLLELASGSVIEKTRHFVEYQGHTWEIDVFTGANEGLVVAEIELSDEEQQFALPGWAGAEVSDDPRYYNVYLSQHPFATWGAD